MSRPSALMEFAHEAMIAALQHPEHRLTLQFAGPQAEANAKRTRFACYKVRDWSRRTCGKGFDRLTFSLTNSDPITQGSVWYLIIKKEPPRVR